MRSFGIASIVFLSSVGAFAACTTTTTVDDADSDGGASSSSGGKKSSSGGSTSSSSGDTSGSSSSSTSSTSSSSSSGGGSTSSGGSDGGGPTGGACTGAGTFTAAANPTAGTCPPNISVSSADLDTNIGWKCPAVKKASCTTADLTTFEANTKNPALKTWNDLGTNLTASCQACIISKDTDAAWNIIVATAADNGATGFVNFGACFGYVEGANCGKGVQYSEFCTDLVCAECTEDGTDQEIKDCHDAAAAGDCANFNSAVQTACPNLQTTLTGCADVLTSIKTLCGP